MGFCNNYLLKGAKFLGGGTTAKAEFEMFSLGSFPGVMRGDKFITGEVYLVKEDDMERVDMLEQSYTRTDIEVGYYGLCAIYLLEHGLPGNLNDFGMREIEGVQEWVGMSHGD